MVKPNDTKFQNLEVYTKKGFDASLKTALKEIESKYGEVTVEKVNEPDLTQLRDTTAKIKLKFKDDSVSNEIDVKVKVKEIPLYHFLVLASSNMKKKYDVNDEIDLENLTGVMYIPKVLDNGEYSTDDQGNETISDVSYDDFRYFNLKIVKKDTTTEVPNKTKIKDIMTADKKIQLEAYCEKIYATEFSNRQIINRLSVK